MIRRFFPKRIRSPSPSTTTTAATASVWSEFRKWATFGKFLGFFPVRNIYLSGSQQERISRPKRVPFVTHILSWSFLYCLSIYVLSTTIILQALRLYITVFAFKDVQQSTDRFAFKTFIGCAHLIRVIAPIFPLLRANDVMSIIHQMTSYDKKFRRRSLSLSRQPHIKFLDCEILLLFVVSMLVIFCNHVYKSEYAEYYVSAENPIFPITYLSGSNLWVAGVVIQIGHTYAEIGSTFLLAVLRYIAKFIEERMSQLEGELKHGPPPPRLEEKEGSSSRVEEDSKRGVHQRRSLPDVFKTANNGGGAVATHIQIEKLCRHGSSKAGGGGGDSVLRKFKGLSEIVDGVNITFRSYILHLCIFTTVLAIVSTYMVIVIVRIISASSGSVSWIQNTRMLRGFQALGATGVHCVYRILLLINVGERIQNAGRKLFKSVLLIDVTLLSPPRSRQVSQMRWVLQGVEFSVRPWDIFTLNRRVITSILGCVVTSVVVLTQFRASDSLQQNHVDAFED